MPSEPRITLPSRWTRIVLVAITLSIAIVVGYVLFEPIPEPAPGDELAWAIEFQVNPEESDTIHEAYTVTKFIGLVHPASSSSPGWEEIDRIELDCSEYGDLHHISNGIDGFLIFGPGSYIKCHDIDLASIVGDLRAYIGPEKCEFPPREGDEESPPCLQTETFFLRAQIAISNTVNDSVYPIFSYPQTLGEDANEWVSLSSRISISNTCKPILQSVDFEASYRSSDDEETDPQTLQEEVFYELDSLSRYSDQKIRWLNDDGKLQVTVADINEQQPVDDFRYFEFRNVPVDFYFGDGGGGEAVITEGTSLYLHYLLFDPSDSCGTCD